LKTFQPISTLLILLGGAAGSAGRRARQLGGTGDSDPGYRRLTLSPLASKRSPAPRRQVVAPEERKARHLVATQNVATEWARSPCPLTTALAGALAGAREVCAALAFASGLASAARWPEEAARQVCLHERIPGTPQPAGNTPLGLNCTAGVTASVCQRTAFSSILCLYYALIEHDD
jgi:hypothetical protein